MNLSAAALAWGLAGCAGIAQAWAQAPLAPEGATASVERGRALLLQRQDTGCVLCHQIPGLPAGGALGPSLHGLAERSTLSQARLHMADARRFNPQTIMPAYLSTEGLHNVAAGLKGQTILTPQALEDILSYLFQPTARTPVIAP
jgi:sulfur-oxidizing protein SoxX